MWVRLVSAVADASSSGAVWIAELNASDTATRHYVPQ
jgi:hypothetical protein